MGNKQSSVNNDPEWFAVISLGMLELQRLISTLKNDVLEGNTAALHELIARKKFKPDAIFKTGFGEGTLTPLGAATGECL